MPAESGPYRARSDPQLLAQGWTRRYLAGPERAQEAIDLYRQLGFEVLAHPLQPTDFGEHCHDCASIVCRSYVMIYTRETEPNHH